ncbi:IS110 family transposase [Paracoccus ravus]|uniref:IS110 family transposase n=1 Tax=Paracoccus ravus TaxID=2447760 RepID=UPI00106E7909|nr:transposase [Paracoccus ravus]
MKCFAGLDVSLKEVLICVVDETGGVLVRGCVACQPEAIVSFFADPQISPTLTVHERGQLSIWLQRSLGDLGLDMICIDARTAHKVLSARLNKSHAADAEGLAQLARTGWFTPVHIRSLDADRLRTLLGARDRLLHLHNDLERHVRGILKTFGFRLTAVHQGKQHQAFRDQLAAAAKHEPIFAVIAEGCIAAHAALCTAAAGIDKELRDIAKGSDLARRLMTIPGVGPIVACRPVSQDVQHRRFSRACGDRALRSLLFEAATALISRVTRFSPLKSWAVRLAGRKGFKKAAVPAARKIAVLMLALWKNGTDFKWKNEAVA